MEGSLPPFTGVAPFPHVLCSSYFRDAPDLSLNTFPYVKSARSPLYFTQDEIQWEYLIFNHLGPHDSVLACIGRYQEGLLLRDQPEESIRTYILESGLAPIPLIKWATQFAEGLAHIHQMGVVHCDVSLDTVRIVGDEDLVIADFARASVNGRRISTRQYEVRYQRPGMDPQRPTIQDDLFALGSALYELSTLRVPYSQETDQQVRLLYAQGDFPSSCDLLLGIIIQKCWHGFYTDALRVRQDLRMLDPIFLSPSPILRLCLSIDIRSNQSYYFFRPFTESRTQ